MFFKEFEDSPVFIMPGIWAGESMVFGWIDHHFKLFVTALNQLFGVLKGILNSNIIIYKAMKQQRRSFEFGRICKWRTAVVMFRNFFGITQSRQRVPWICVVVISPVGYFSEGGSGMEAVRLSREGIERHKAAIAAAINTNIIKIEHAASMLL